MDEHWACPHKKKSLGFLPGAPTALRGHDALRGHGNGHLRNNKQPESDSSFFAPGAAHFTLSI